MISSDTLTFIKLGGSLITDKTEEGSFRGSQMYRLGHEIAAALREQPDLRLLIGHGSGSFGHFAAKKHGTMQGVHTPEQWQGFGEVATVAAELNYLVASVLFECGIPVFRVQPSATARCEDGHLRHMQIDSLELALRGGLVPLVYGDVAFDTVRGGTIISTESILSFLAQKLPVRRILLLGEVEGVLDENGRLITEIHPGNIEVVEPALGGSGGTDVTGGMLTKVGDMLALARAVPGLTIRILDGREPDLLQNVLTGSSQPGTLIHA